jgi:hypothetical protein
MNELCSWLARSEKRHSIGFGFSIFMLVSQGRAAGLPGHYRVRWVSVLGKAALGKRRPDLA